MLMSVAISQSTRKHLMATPPTAAAPPIQRQKSRHTPKSRKPPRIILSVCISEILPANIQKAADEDAQQQPYGGARDEITQATVVPSTLAGYSSTVVARLLFDALPNFFPHGLLHFWPHGFHCVARYGETETGCTHCHG